MFVEIFLPRAEATGALGRKLSQRLELGDVIALWGGLGAGKTTLARGLIMGADSRITDVPSPTFTLVQTYDLPIGPLWHFDLYRLKRPEELIELGWRDAEDAVRLIEWPQNGGRFLPPDRLDISLTEDADGRRARLEPRGERWQERLHEF